MVPHMIFAEGVRDAGSRRLWQSRRNSQAPSDVDTSCITQPPLLAVAAWAVAQALPAVERRDFLADLFPRLVAYHQWLYRERDLEHRGLVTLMHPWECGLDTSGGLDGSRPAGVGSRGAALPVGRRPCVQC